MPGETKIRFYAALTRLFSAKLKATCRRIIATGLYQSGLMRVVNRLARAYELSAPAGFRLSGFHKSSSSKFCILCYHRVGTEGAPIFSRLDPLVFEAQMRYLQMNFRVVPLGQLWRELKEPRLREPTVSVTFDDGYRDLYTHAFPVLQRFQIPATIYLIGQCVETGELPWYDRIFLGLDRAPGQFVELDLDGSRRFDLCSPETRAEVAWQIVCHLRTISDPRRRQWLAAFEKQFRLPPHEVGDRMLNWEQVRTMHRGGIHFGAHTMTHPVVSQLPLSALAEELVQAKHYLEAGLDAPVEDFAYPFGKEADIQHSAAEACLLHAGYRSAVTTIEGCNRPGVNPYRLRRMQVGDDRSMGLFAFNLARVFLEDSSASLTFVSATDERMTKQQETAGGLLSRNGRNA